MAFLDFIKRRQATRPEPTATASPERSYVVPSPTARALYLEREAWAKANQKPLSPEAKAQADRVMATLDKGSFHLPSQFASSPSESGAHSEPMMQKAFNQEKVAPALSPTTEQVGKVADKGSHGHQNPPARNAPSADSPARDRNGWER